MIYRRIKYILIALRFTNNPRYYTFFQGLRPIFEIGQKHTKSNIKIKIKTKKQTLISIIIRN